MLVAIKSPSTGKTFCHVTVQPLSPVRVLIQKAVAEIDAGLAEEGVYLRPPTWDASFGLHPDSLLPLVLNEYVLDTLKNHPALIEYQDEKEKYQPVPPRNTTSFGVHFTTTHSHDTMIQFAIPILFWTIIAWAIVKTLFF